MPREPSAHNPPYASVRMVYTRPDEAFQLANNEEIVDVKHLSDQLKLTILTRLPSPRPGVAG